MEFEIIIRQAKSYGCQAVEVHSIYAELPCLPQRGDDIILHQHGGQTYTVFCVTHEFRTDPLSTAAGILHVGKTIITITPKGLA